MPTFMIGIGTEERFLEIFSLTSLFVITDINLTEKILSGMVDIFIIICTTIYCLHIELNKTFNTFSSKPKICNA